MGYRSQWTFTTKKCPSALMLHRQARYWSHNTWQMTSKINPWGAATRTTQQEKKQPPNLVLHSKAIMRINHFLLHNICLWAAPYKVNLLKHLYLKNIGIERNSKLHAGTCNVLWATVATCFFSSKTRDILKTLKKKKKDSSFLTRQNIFYCNAELGESQREGGNQLSRNCPPLSFITAGLPLPPPLLDVRH